MRNASRVISSTVYSLGTLAGASTSESVFASVSVPPMVATAAATRCLSAWSVLSDQPVRFTTSERVRQIAAAVSTPRRSETFVVAASSFFAEENPCR